MSVLYQYTIYDHPRDYPEGFVVRQWRIASGEGGPTPEEAWTAPSLEAARALVPAGLFCLPRVAEDDPVIVETWT